jgi:hypothetical protein
MSALIYFCTFLQESSSTFNQTENDTSQLGQATSDDTVGWQTFEDSQYGFKLQAPADWKKPESSLIPIVDFTISPDDPYISGLPNNQVVVR